jgi:hypothetical protein
MDENAPKGAPRFQADPHSIFWRLHFRSPPSDVFPALATAEGRSRFWAESAEEEGGVIHFVVPGNLESRGRVIETIPSRSFVTEYFGWCSSDCRPIPPAEPTSRCAATASLRRIVWMSLPDGSRC